MKTYKTVNDMIDDINIDKINYVRFGGRGIVSGLKNNPLKNSFYKIISVGGDKLTLKAYRAKKLCFLSRFYYNQECEVINKNEFSKLQRV